MHGEQKPIQIDGTVILRKVPAINYDNCDGCFYKNLRCAESSISLSGSNRMACSRDNYIWEVVDADVDEG